MKSTKKVRTLTAPNAKVIKTGTRTAKTSAPKKKTGVKITVSNSYTPCSRKRSKDSPKTGKSRVNHAKDSGTKKKSVAKKQKDRRYRELSTGECDAFVIQAATREKVSPEELVTVDRRRDKSALPRQSVTEQTITEQKPQSERKLDRRQKIQRRRQIDPTTCERDYSQEEIEFMNALDEYKRNSGRMFPTCSEILEVFCNLGYAKLLHEECVEINANLESGDANSTATETSTMHRANEQSMEQSCLSSLEFLN